MLAVLEILLQMSHSEEGREAIFKTLDDHLFPLLKWVRPTPATHAILTGLKAGECIRHSIQTQKVSYSSRRSMYSSRVKKCLDTPSSV